MITVNHRAAQPVRWQQLWRAAITDPHELLRLLDLGHLASQLLPDGDTGFPLRVPHGFAARMRRGDPNDPLLLQVLPQAVELSEAPGFTHDAVGDLSARTAHGVLHKYEGRALLIATGSCAVHCRYCFRRHFPYAAEIAAANHWQDALQHLRGDSSITEVILSGGDPLSLSTAKLVELSSELTKIPHFRRLRIHTRLPVVLPERVDAPLLAWLANLPFTCVIVLHVNHPNELDASVANACADLRKTGALLLNQTVLLRHINDSEQTLVNLSESLIACGILPYYLHQLDRVQGAAHFEVDDDTACGLAKALQDRLPGYLVPRLVREVPGTASKQPLL